MDKILFLDIDGVLNSHMFDMKTQNHPKLGFLSELDSESIYLLNQLFSLVKDLKIVISSDRRYEMSREDLIFYLEKAGLIKDKILDVCDSSVKKQQAIEQWIEDKNPKSYVVLDDDWLFDLNHPCQKNFVKVSGYEGFKSKYIDLIVSILEN